jgi:cytochrome c oxidase subunit 2
MIAQVPLFPERASVNAYRVDALFFFAVAVTGLMTLLVTVLIIYFGIKYRRRGEGQRTPRILGSLRLELFWTVSPLVVFAIMFWWGAKVFTAVALPPPGAMEVYVVGKQWMWKIQHQDGHREINQLHVPLGEPVKLTLTSEDVIHDFFVPAFRQKLDVIPGRYVSTWFQPTKVGTYHLFCSQYCGTNHAGMVGSVVVMRPADYQEWLNSTHVEGSLALEGRKLFLKLQCVTCHSANFNARAPVLEELFGRPVHLADGRTIIADDAYLRESILYPRAKIVQGWEPIMPTFKGQVDEEDLIRLIAFIKSLPRGGTPMRTEEFPAPVGAPTGPAEAPRAKP